jgi:hypothetical protein
VLLIGIIAVQEYEGDGFELEWLYGCKGEAMKEKVTKERVGRWRGVGAMGGDVGQKDTD